MLNHWFVKAMAVGVLVAGLLIGAACDDSTQSSADHNTAQVVGNQQEIYAKVLPVPIYNWSEQRSDLIQIYNALSESHDTWTVFEANNGTPISVCPSKGFPIPVTDQLTNPSYLAQSNNGGSARVDQVLPQPEPTGLYTGPTAGTWVLCVQSDGSVEPVYSEPNVLAFAHAVRIANGQIQDVPGASGSIKINIGQPGK